MKQEPIVITTGHGRAAGTTYKQLAALPDGGIYVISSWPMQSHCRMILEAQGRRPDAVGFVALDSIPEFFRGMRRETAVDIDHDARDRMSRQKWVRTQPYLARLDRPLPEIRYTEWRTYYPTEVEPI